MSFKWVASGFWLLGLVAGAVVASVLIAFQIAVYPLQDRADYRSVLESTNFAVGVSAWVLLCVLGGIVLSLIVHTLARRGRVAPRAAACLFGFGTALAALLFPYVSTGVELGNLGPHPQTANWVGYLGVTLIAMGWLLVGAGVSWMAASRKTASSVK